MALNKQRLTFDEADIATSDQVGAHILGSADVKITSTTIGADEALDVNVANEIASLTDYEEDEAHASGDIGSFVLAVREDVLAAGTDADGDYSAFKVNALGELYVHDSDALDELIDINSELDGIKLDTAGIRTAVELIDNVIYTDNGAFTDGASQGALIFGVDDSNTFQPFKMNAAGELLVAADISVVTGHEKLEDSAHSSGDVGSYVLAVRQDLLAADTSADGDYASFKVNSLGALYVTGTLEGNAADDAADAGNPIKVGSRSVTGPLTAVSADNDRADLLSDLYRRVYVHTAPNIAGSNASVTVTTTASQIDASLLSGRTRVIIQNVGTKDIAIGFDNSVTFANGLVVQKGASYDTELGEGIELWAISQSGSQDIRIIQIG